MTETIKKLIEKKREKIAAELGIDISQLSFRVDDDYVYYEYIAEAERQYYCTIKLSWLEDILRYEKGGENM